MIFMFKIVTKLSGNDFYILVEFVCIGNALTRPAEHVQHPLSHNESTTNIDGRYEGSHEGQTLDRISWIVTTSHQDQTYTREYVS